MWLQGIADMATPEPPKKIAIINTCFYMRSWQAAKGRSGTDVRGWIMGDRWLLGCVSQRHVVNNSCGVAAADQSSSADVRKHTSRYSLQRRSCDLQEMPAAWGGLHGASSVNHRKRHRQKRPLVRMRIGFAPCRCSRCRRMLCSCLHRRIRISTEGSIRMSTRRTK